MTVSKSLEENVEFIKSAFKDCDDVIYRTIEIGKENKVMACIICIDGISDKNLISEYAIQIMLTLTECSCLDINFIKSNLAEKLAKEAISANDVKEQDDLDKIITFILSGDTALFIDGVDKALIIASKGSPSRSIAEPETETVVRGPRDGFSEIMRVNTALVRRRIKDTKLKIKVKQVGRRSKTDISVLYIEDIVNQELLQEVNRRIDNIDIDLIEESSILEFLIEDDYKSPFPQIENTERPDTVAASLYEGRVALIVDNTPFALIVPATLGTLFQSTEDHYSRWPISTVVRLLRIIAVFLTTLSPSLYIAITSYHPGILPTVLAFQLASSRVYVPFPAVVEAFLMELTIEILRESGTRISGPIGTTISIVGGIVIGSASVEAGIVSPLKIIIVAVTTISFFAIPSFEFASGLRVWRFIIMLLAAVLGLYGVMLGVVILLVHFAKLESFGIPFTSPYSGLGLKGGDLRDTLIKAPIQRLEERPVFTFPKNKRRMRKR